MKRYLKIYFITTLSSVLCILFPWWLAKIGVTSEIEVLEWQGILSGMVAFVFTLVYVIRQVKTWKPRLLIIVLNPAIYYIVVVAYIVISLASEPWQGWKYWE